MDYLFEMMSLLSSTTACAARPKATAGLCLGILGEAGQEPGDLCLQRLGSVVRFSIYLLLQKAPYKVAPQGSVWAAGGDLALYSRTFEDEPGNIL